MGGVLFSRDSLQCGQRNSLVLTEHVSTRLLRTIITAENPKKSFRPHHGVLEMPFRPLRWQHVPRGPF